MDDKRLDEILSDAAHTYRPPPDAPLDLIWSRVEAEAFASQPSSLARRAPGWRAFGGAIAATLVLGVAIGRMSAPRAASVDATAASAARQAPAHLASNGVSDPYQRTTQEFLGRTVLLIASLPSKDGTGVADDKINEQAKQLLGTARLLLDSPVGHEPRMKDLLEDLELVLAQVARLQPQHRGDALNLIRQALEERDVVPRIRSAAADLSIGDN
jgi:hypothetical protein